MHSQKKCNVKRNVPAGIKRSKEGAFAVLVVQEVVWRYTVLDNVRNHVKGLHQEKIVGKRVECAIDWIEVENYAHKQ